jgi:hypothetical protein
METFKKHRLESLLAIEELIALIGAEKFYRYQETVFQKLSSLQPGEVFDIAGNVRTENIEVFIKCACMYIVRTSGDCNIVFSDDYRKIKGICSFNAGRKEMEEYQEQVKRMCGEKKQ